MDAGAADPLRAARPEEGEEKPKAPENQDDGYETSNSGETRRKPSSAEGSPAPAAEPSPPPEPPYEPLMRYPEPEPEYRHFEHHQENPYQHFPFPKYNEPYPFKRENDVPYDMSQHAAHHYQQMNKRDEELYNGIKRECEDPYSFVEEDPMMMMSHQQPQPHHMPHMHPHQHPHMMHQQMMMNQPKKRGRKKKIKDENGMEIKVEPGMEGALVPRPVKERKKHDRFNGMSEEEVSRRTLPDHLAENLDIIIIGINPGLFAAYKGHHYAGPGNHFWKCLYLSGLTREQMSADEDYKLLNFGIGFTNMVPRATKGSADLTRREIKEGSAILLEKLQTFRPKVAVFNGKLIYEVFSGKKDFCFGKQPDTIAGTNTYMWVMPSSSARCAQLPRAADKVPFYAALKKFRDYLNGLVAHVEETELVFPDNTSRRPQEEMEIRRQAASSRLTMEPEPGDTIILEDGTEVPLKKKRGRPKKVKLENGETAPPTPRAPRQPRPPPALDPNGDQPPKKKRGRPKKIRPEEQAFLLQQQQQQQQQQQAQQQQPTNNTMLQGGINSLQPLHESNVPQYLGGLGGSGDLQMMYHQQIDDNAAYFQPQPHNTGMDSPLDVCMSRGYDSPGGAGAGAGGGTGAGAGYAASPRPVYASPRSQGYSPGPARTPQPQPQYPQSPAAFSAPSPPRAGFGSPAAAAAAAARGASFAARSPLLAHSPAPYQHTQQASPARFSQSPHPHHPHPYSHSPAPQGTSRSYSRSPAPAGAGAGGVAPGAAGGVTAFPAASPGTYASPAHTPYSHHSSPAPNYPPSNVSNVGGNVVNSGLCALGGGEMGGGMSPAAGSPGALHVDFEPPAPPATPARDQTLSPTDDMHDYTKTSTGSEVSPGVGSVGSVGGGFAPGMFDHERLPYADQQPQLDHYRQEQGEGVPESPRLDQLHQHPSMYPSNFNRSTPEEVVGGESSGFGSAGAFRAATHHHSPHHHHYDTGSPGEYGGGGTTVAAKAKSVDVASKSLSGLESLVDQIPSIAEGGAGAGAGASAGAGAAADPAPPPALPEYAPALYPPYPAYTSTPYSNNGYGAPFVGYGGGWGAAVMRPAPGYLSDWQYGYSAVPPAYSYNTPYYTHPHPPPAHHQQTHYLSAPPLLELHKNGEHSGGVPPVPTVPSVPSVGFGGFC